MVEAFSSVHASTIFGEWQVGFLADLEGIIIGFLFLFFAGREMAVFGQSKPRFVSYYPFMREIEPDIF